MNNFFAVMRVFRRDSFFSGIIQSVMWPAAELPERPVCYCCPGYTGGTKIPAWLLDSLSKAKTKVHSFVKVIQRLFAAEVGIRCTTACEKSVTRAFDITRQQASAYA